MSFTNTKNLSGDKIERDAQNIHQNIHQDIHQDIQKIAPVNSAATGASPKPPGKLKETLSLASTALPIAGAIGTLGVWLAATFYVGEVQIVPDRPFNTLEVRVSDKKGQESVFHSPHFQLMPGRYHLEVTIDSQYKQHADVKTAFRHSTSVPVHIAAASVIQPAVPNATTENAPVSGSAMTNSLNIFTDKSEVQAKEVTMTKSLPANDNNETGISSENSETTSTKKKWWQFWKKVKSEN